MHAKLPRTVPHFERRLPANFNQSPRRVRRQRFSCDRFVHRSRDLRHPLQPLGEQMFCPERPRKYFAKEHAKYPVRVTASEAAGKTCQSIVHVAVGVEGRQRFRQVVVYIHRAVAVRVCLVDNFRAESVP